jgi:hypothetical protein
MMGASERPTLTPPFDPAEFARESESKLRVSKPLPPREPQAGSATKIRRADPRAEEDLVELAFEETERATRPNATALTLQSVPLLAVAPDRMRGMQLDHRAGFILSHVDGVSDVETILDVSGMASDEALRILNDLAQKGIITAG